MWVPTNLLCHLKSQCFFPCDIKDIQALCKSIMLRAAYCTLSDWASFHRSLMTERQHLDSNLVHPHADWLHTSAVSVAPSLARI